MSMSLNRVELIGNLGADPEIKKLQDGRSIVNLRLATSENWTDRNSGEKRERTEWHRVVIFNDGLAKIAETLLQKGTRIFVEGQLQTRKWTDQSGQERYMTEVVLQFNSRMIVLAGGKPREDSTRPTGDPQGRRDDLDDEIPF